MGTVHEQDAETLHGRTRQLTVVHRLLNALVDGRSVALRNDAADDLVDEFVAGVALERLEHDVAVPELAAAPCLLLVAPLRACLLANRLQVGNARLAELHFHPEAAPET